VAIVMAASELIVTNVNIVMTKEIWCTRKTKDKHVFKTMLLCNTAMTQPEIFICMYVSKTLYEYSCFLDSTSFSLPFLIQHIPLTRCNKVKDSSTTRVQ